MKPCAGRLQDSEQTEVPKNMEPDLPFTMQTPSERRDETRKKYNPTVTTL